MRALWRPAWYELDQALKIDTDGTYAFCAGRLDDVAPTGAYF